MKERTSPRPNLTDYVADLRRKKRPTFLDGIEQIVDWHPLEKFLRRKLRRHKDAVGNPAYPPLLMFKILLLQRCYNLSDEAIESSLYDRISFARFTALSLEDDVPDATTICRFRSSLAERDLLTKLLGLLNRQFEAKGLLGREGAIVDATVIISSRRPTKVIDIMPDDREEGEDNDMSASVSYSDDTEAAWLRKGNKSFYGFKVHAATDSRDGFILGGHVTPANRSDTGEFERLVLEADVPPKSYIFADKGYTSKANRETLVGLRFKDGIMHKAARNRPLTDLERLDNRLVSKVRATVERGFGTLKRLYGFARSRYVGMAKVDMKFHLNAMAFNLKKGLRLWAC